MNKPRPYHICIRVPLEVKEKLRSLAWAERKSETEIVIRLVNEAKIQPTPKK